MLYDIGFLIFSVFYLPALIFKGKLHADFRERFGAYSAAKRATLRSCEGAIWIQAVSVGEVALLKSFIESLKRRFPGRPIVLSTITKTGNDLARRLFSGKATVVYFPLDFSFVVKKVLGLIRPSLFVMVETEIWPNFLRHLRKAGVPSVLVNGRISDRSFGKYRMARPFIAGVLKGIGKLCMQSDIDAERIILLGAARKKVVVTGNMKFDIDVSPDPQGAQAIAGALDLRGGDKLIVAGSTHPGEEEEMMRIFKALAAEFSGLKLLIAPRHVERSGEIEALVRRAGFEPVRMSAVHSTQSTVRVFILDTIGKLNSAYSIAAIVFVGGSLVRHGGQNPIEPAMAGKAVLFGPHMFNFKDAVKALLDSGAAVQVKDAIELASKMRGLLRDEKARSSLGEKARDVVLANRGATERNIREIW